jgi:hypothetical protein
VNLAALHGPLASEETTLAGTLGIALAMIFHSPFCLNESQCELPRKTWQIVGLYRLTNGFQGGW